MARSPTLVPQIHPLAKIGELKLILIITIVHIDEGESYSALDVLNTMSEFEHLQMIIQFLS